MFDLQRPSAHPLETRAPAPVIAGLLLVALQGLTPQQVDDAFFIVHKVVMDLSLFLLLFGDTCALWSWPAFLAPAAYVASIPRFQILPEERVLEAKFGAEYLRHKQGVRRWL